MITGDRGTADGAAASAGERLTVRSPTDEPAPLPSSVSAARIKRAAIRLSALLVLAIVIVTLLPGLGSLRDRFADARPIWVVIGCGLELLSMLSYVLAFRYVFCKRMTWGTSYKIGMAEQGVDSLLPVGGAGGLAFGAWALRRGGMSGDLIARRTVAFFLLTSVPNVVTLVLVCLGVATGVLPGQANAVLTIVPAVVGVSAIVATLGLGRLSRQIEAKLHAQTKPSRLARIAPALRATADGVDDAVQLLRHGGPLLLLGLVGYMAFDIMTLWASFRALGSTPELAIVWIGYLIGQLGNLIPVPGGIGGVELGLIGALVLYGLPAVISTAAVLLYRVIELWVPAVVGAIAFVQVRRLLRREAESIELCKPGEAVEIIGRGPVITRPAE